MNGVLIDLSLDVYPDTEVILPMLGLLPPLGVHIMLVPTPYLATRFKHDSHHPIYKFFPNFTIVVRKI